MLGLMGMRVGMMEGRRTLKPGMRVKNVRDKARKVGVVRPWYCLATGRNHSDIDLASSLYSDAFVERKVLALSLDCSSPLIRGGLHLQCFLATKQ
jgi:hypothetical protein